MNEVYKNLIVKRYNNSYDVIESINTDKSRYYLKFYQDRTSKEYFDIVEECGGIEGRLYLYDTKIKFIPINDNQEWLEGFKLECGIYQEVSSTIIEKAIDSIYSTISQARKSEYKRLQLKEEMTNKGKNMLPVTELIQEAKEVHIDIDNTSSLKEQFQKVISETSEVSKKINNEHSLGDNKLLVKSFMEAKSKIEELQTNKPTKISLINKYFNKIPLINSIGNSVKDIQTEHKSVQVNIDELFGIIYDKHEKLIVIAEGLQEAKSNMVAQSKASNEILNKLNVELEVYDNPSDIPIRDTLLKSQIQSHIAKLNDRVVKVEGAFIATQATIIKLGQDLPSKKADLTDESAIGSLLSNVDDFQKMWEETSILVSGLTEATAEKVHTVVENLMQIQIDDTHTTKYLSDVNNRGTKFAKMLETKTKEYETKVRQDAIFISTIASGKSIEEAKNAVKLIK